MGKNKKKIILQGFMNSGASMYLLTLGGDEIWPYYLC